MRAPGPRPVRSRPTSSWVGAPPAGPAPGARPNRRVSSGAVTALTVMPSSGARSTSSSSSGHRSRRSSMSSSTPPVARLTSAGVACIPSLTATSLRLSRRARSTALTIASAAWAARSAASPTASSPNAATSPIGPMPSTRPPKVRTFSTISSSARAVSSVASGRAGGTSAARSNAMRRRSHRRPEAGAGTTLGRAAAAAGGDGGALTTRGRATGRRSMRARRVLREMPSSAAVREMFPRVWPSTSTRCSRIASSSETASGRAGAPVTRSPATPSASAVSSSEEDCSTARSITLDSSRTLPGQA